MASRFSRGVGIFCLLLLGALLGGCPQGSVRAPAEPGQISAVREKLERLDVEYEILLKDDPPQSETVTFRQFMAEADKALDAKNPQKAAELAGEAEKWMEQARARYRADHEAGIKAGTSPETCKDLMDEAMFFVEKARSARKSGGEWKAELYYQAAIEQGELALIVAQRSPEQALELIELAGKMETIYREAGRPEAAKDLKERVIASLQDSINALGKRIEDMIAGRAKGYDRATLMQGGEVFENARRQLQELNDLRNRIIEQAGLYAPGRIEARDYQGSILSWTGNKRREIANPVENDKPGNTYENDAAEVMKAELRLHNKKYREGAESLQGSGISLKETGITNQGSALIIKGELQNLRSEPIYKPRVTVVGYVYGEVVDLGYNRFAPYITTSFQIQIKGFNTEALNTSGVVPPHELVLIFEEDNGLERRVITSTQK